MSNRDLALLFEEDVFEWGKTKMFYNKLSEKSRHQPNFIFRVCELPGVPCCIPFKICVWYFWRIVIHSDIHSLKPPIIFQVIKSWLFVSSFVLFWRWCIRATRIFSYWGIHDRHRKSYILYVVRQKTHSEQMLPWMLPTSHIVQYHNTSPFFSQFKSPQFTSNIQVWGISCDSITWISCMLGSMQCWIKCHAIMDHVLTAPYQVAYNRKRKRSRFWFVMLWL